MQEASAIVSEVFLSAEATGVLRIQQHAKKIETAISPKHIDGLVADLKELFPTP